MSWNYRVIKRNGYLGLHGVYYDERGNITAMDQNPNAPRAENRDELKIMLQLMLEALEKPFLDYDEVEDERPQ